MCSPIVSFKHPIPDDNDSTGESSQGDTDGVPALSLVAAFASITTHICALDVKFSLREAPFRLVPRLPATRHQFLHPKYNLWMRVSPIFLAYLIFGFGSPWPSLERSDS